MRLPGAHPWVVGCRWEAAMRSRRCPPTAHGLAHRWQHYAATSPAPPIANERLTLNRAGDVVLQLKSPYHDGTTHVVMSPLELMQRLAALVPRPRLRLIRCHGVLAPNAKLRSAIIPSAPVNAPNAAAIHADAPHSSAPVRLSFAQLLKLLFDIDIAQCPRVVVVP